MLRHNCGWPLLQSLQIPHRAVFHDYAMAGFDARYVFPHLDNFRRDLMPERHRVIVPVAREVDVCPADPAGTDLYDHVVIVWIADVERALLDVEEFLTPQSPTFHIFAPF
jgi:hypothetical protein